MDSQVYTSATRHLHQPGSCPTCGQLHQVRWIYDGRLIKRDRYLAEESCRPHGSPHYVASPTASF